VRAFDGRSRLIPPADKLRAKEPDMKRTDTASRTVLATPEKVYAALIDPDAMLQWLPPTGMTARLEHFDARAGGGYRMVLTYADASEAAGKATADSDVVDVSFIELVRDVRVVQAVEFESDDPAFAGTMTMTWKLIRTDDGTRIEIRADDVPPGISEEDHATGLASSLANLAVYLAR
jgi:uncharacterized protein YndB with AHSA1/START domain